LLGSLLRSGFKPHEDDFMEIEDKYVKDVQRLIPFPKIAMEVLSIAHESDCDIPKLSRKIEQDPNLTANMLRMANSAYFGHMKMITSVRDIIVRLGLETVKLIAITSASVGLLRSPQSAYNLKPGALWRHSYATAILAATIGRHAQLDEDSSLYTAALLHDIGKVILNRPLQIELNHRETPHKSLKMVELERLILGTNHAQIGMRLLQLWGLPDKIVVPIGCHHDREVAEAKLLYSKIVYLSNILIESLGIHSIDPENYFFSIEELVNSTEEELPDVPNFQEKMETIIEEFFERFNETVGMFSENAA